MFIVLLIRHLILSEWHVSYCNVKKVIGITGIFKACDFYIRMGIELLCDTPGKPVKLRPVQPASLHFLRQTAIKIPNPGGGI